MKIAASAREPAMKREHMRRRKMAMQIHLEMRFFTEKGTVAWHVAVFRTLWTKTGASPHRNSNSSTPNARIEVCAFN
jgi:hypothetical protein